MRRLPVHVVELDWIRGVAVLLVLACHLLGWSYPGWETWPSVRDAPLLKAAFSASSQLGWLGVQLFFVLSGFLISGILLDRRRGKGFLGRFFVRRLLRIQPVLLVTLVFVALLGSMGWGLKPMRLEQAGVCMLAVANLGVVTGVESPYGPLWSLAVEEQFYLLWPAWIRRLDIRTLAVVCVVLMATGPTLRAVAWLAGRVDDLASVTWFNLDGLLAGSLMAIRIRCLPRSAARTTAVRWLAVGASLLVILWATDALERRSLFGAALFALPWVLVFAGGMVLLILRERPVPEWLRGPASVLAFLGSISYGLYLYHGLVMHLFDHGLAWLAYRRPWESPGLSDMAARSGWVIVGSIAVASISRHTLEAWFLRLGTVRSGARPTGPAPDPAAAALSVVSARGSMIARCPPFDCTTPCPARRGNSCLWPGLPAPSRSTAADPRSTTTRTSATSAAS